MRVYVAPHANASHTATRPQTIDPGDETQGISRGLANELNNLGVTVVTRPELADLTLTPTSEVKLIPGAGADCTTRVRAESQGVLIDEVEVRFQYNPVGNPAEGGYAATAKANSRSLAASIVSSAKIQKFEAELPPKRKPAKK